MTSEDGDPDDQSAFTWVGDRGGDPVARTVGENYELIDRENLNAWIGCNTSDVVDLGKYR